MFLSYYIAHYLSDKIRMLIHLDKRVLNENAIFSRKFWKDKTFYSKIRSFIVPNIRENF